MLLGEYYTAIRADLGITSELADSDLDRAIVRAVADLSRVIPREAVLEFTINPEVADELVTLDDTWVPLTSKPLKRGSEVLKASDLSMTYTRDVDYEIDYANGQIKALPGGHLAFPYTFPIDFGPQHIKYSKHSLAIDLTPYQANIYRIMEVIYPVEANQPRLTQSHKYLAGVLYLQLSEKDAEPVKGQHVQVFYGTNHVPPTTTTPGSYPRVLDEVVLKGCGAYSLLVLSEKTQRQATLDLAASRTALNYLGELHTSITTLRTSLASIHTAIGTHRTAISATHALTKTALDQVSTYAGLARTAIDKVSTDSPGYTSPVTKARTELDGIGAILTLAETALDKVTTHLEGVADSTMADLASAAGYMGAVTSDLATAVVALTDVETALDNAGVRIDTDMDAALLAATAVWLDEVAHILHSDSMPNAEDFLETGKDLINTTNIGEQVAATYGRYAELALGMADRWAAKRDSHLTEANLQSQAAQTYIAEGQQRLNIVDIHLKVAQGRLEQVTRYIQSATQRTGIANTFIAEAEQRLAEAAGKITAARVWVDLAVRHTDEAAGYLSVGRQYIDEGRARVEQVVQQVNEFGQLNTQANNYIQEYIQLLGQITARQSEASRYQESANLCRQQANDLLAEYKERRFEYLSLLNANATMRSTSSVASAAQPA